MLVTTKEKIIWCCITPSLNLNQGLAGCLGGNERCSSRKDCCLGLCWEIKWNGCGRFWLGTFLGRVGRLHIKKDAVTMLELKM